jgi:hypothetical protein
MTKAPIDLQDLRRRTYRKAKSGKAPLRVTLSQDKTRIVGINELISGIDPKNIQDRSGPFQ